MKYTKLNELERAQFFLWDVAVIREDFASVPPSTEGFVLTVGIHLIIS
jgi:hypothetical protein